MLKNILKFNFINILCIFIFLSGIAFFGKSQFFDFLFFLSGGVIVLSFSLERYLGVLFLLFLTAMVLFTVFDLATLANIFGFLALSSWIYLIAYVLFRTRSMN